MVEVEEEVKENPFTTSFWVNVVLVVLCSIVAYRLTFFTKIEEPEIFDPYSVLGITVGANDRTIRSAYRKMAKL